MGAPFRPNGANLGHLLRDVALVDVVVNLIVNLIDRRM